MCRNVTWGVFLCLAVLLWGTAARAEYEAGQSAWKAGRYAQALMQWRAAARTGDSRATLALGRAFIEGLGVPYDKVLAHKWLSLAAGQGHTAAAREREALAAKMTPRQIASAQAKARAWRRSVLHHARAIPKTAASSPLAVSPPARSIREAQALMKTLGYNPGPADGLWGPRTARAYAAFLRDAGLPSGKVLTPEALRAMRGKGKAADTVAKAGAKGPQHGSIAFSQEANGGYAWGIAWSFDSSAGARAEALGQCRAHDGTRCSQVGWFQEACGALAIGDDNGYGTGWGATAAAAKRNALAQCRVSNNDCRIEVARCAQSEEAGGSGRTDREDTAVSREPADTSDDSCGRWEATSTPTWNEEGLRRGGLNIPREHRGATRAEAEDYAQRTCSGYSNHPEYSLLLVSCVVGAAKCLRP